MKSDFYIDLRNEKQSVKRSSFQIWKYLENSS